jgi:hypothetical protein
MYSLLIIPFYRNHSARRIHLFSFFQICGIQVHRDWGRDWYNYHACISIWAAFCFFPYMFFSFTSCYLLCPHNHFFCYRFWVLLPLFCLAERSACVAIFVFPPLACSCASLVCFLLTSSYIFPVEISGHRLAACLEAVTKQKQSHSTPWSFPFLVRADTINRTRAFCVLGFFFGSGLYQYQGHGN